MGVFGTVFLAAVVAAVVWWLYRSFGKNHLGRHDGRLISAVMAVSSHGSWLATLLFGQSDRHADDDALLCHRRLCATVRHRHFDRLLLCSQPVMGKNFFPRDLLHSLMVTPLGVRAMR